MSDRVQKVTSLKDLAELGLASEEEYASARQELLGVSSLDADEIAALVSAGVFNEEELEPFREDAVFRKAEEMASKGDEADLLKAAELYESLGSYNGASARAEAIRRKVDDMKKAAAAKKKRIGVIAGVVAAVVVAAILVVAQIVMPEMENQKAYNDALAMGDTESAVKAFEDLGDYKDSREQIERIKAAQEAERERIKAAQEAEHAAKMVSNGALKTAKVGDTVILGKYEQDNSLFNGKEDIEWRVLTFIKGKALLVSVCGLDAKEFNSRESKGNKWESSDLKKWLQGSFAENAGLEKCKNSLTCLSVDEVEQYFSSNNDRTCYATDYAKSQGAHDACDWWLRSPGHLSSGAAFVDCDGYVHPDGYGVARDSVAVRPALWINL